MLLIVICACLYFLPAALGVRLRALVFPFVALWLAACLYGALDYAVTVLPHKLTDRSTDLLEMENNLREYLATGDATWLKGKIPYPHAAILEQTLGSDSVRKILPSHLLSPNAPLAPSRQSERGGVFVENGHPEQVPPLDKPFYSSYGKVPSEKKNGITLVFNVPRGTREVELQVAGYPSLKGIALKLERRHRDSILIAPAIDPGAHWQTISVRLDPRARFFKMSARDQSENGWLAFSVPRISTGGAPGRWARSLAASSFYFVDAGLVLILLGALAGLAGSTLTSPPASCNPPG